MGPGFLKCKIPRISSQPPPQQCLTLSYLLQIWTSLFLLMITHMSWKSFRNHWVKCLLSKKGKQRTRARKGIAQHESLWTSFRRVTPMARQAGVCLLVGFTRLCSCPSCWKSRVTEFSRNKLSFQTLCPSQSWICRIPQGLPQKLKSN